jgi:hypothetical protein
VLGRLGYQSDRLRRLIERDYASTLMGEEPGIPTVTTANLQDRSTAV